MRDLGKATGFENAVPGWHRYDLAVWIGDPDSGMTSIPHPQKTCREYHQDGAREKTV